LDEFGPALPYSQYSKAIVVDLRNLYLGLLAGELYISRIAKENMRNLKNWIWNVRIGHDNKGQDLIKYALMAGVVAVVAVAIMPGLAVSISTSFWKIGSLMSELHRRAGDLTLAGL
jgi:pilus assembly protein Flp/PilA